ncbi:MAG: DUF5060 domain-containing protein, partial [Planctomycetota bacterium]
GLALTSLTVGGQVYNANELSTGTSTGLVSSILGAGPITAADDLDAGTYFARSVVSPDLWTISFPSAWSDRSGSEEDFFLIEAGGNDTLRIAPITADGVGQHVTFAVWSNLGLEVPDGPNVGQALRSIQFSGTDLRKADGSPINDLDVLTGLEIRSSTVDGAVFAWRDGDPTTLSGQARPEVTSTVDAIPLGDDFQTTVSLQVDVPNVPSGAPLNYLWEIPGATFVNGTNPFVAAPEVAFAGDVPTYAEVLVVPVEQPELFGKARFELGLDLPGPARLFGSTVAAQKLEIWVDGPDTDVFSDTPNPFLDRRLDVTFRRPDGSEQVVPGFYAGDGRGNNAGRVWKARFTPDVPGTWTFDVSYRFGVDVAVADNPLAGNPGAPDGASGTLEISPRDPDGRGFLKRGHLRYGNKHYRRFDDGTYFIKGATNSPENFLAFRGFDGTFDVNGLDGLHGYGPHLDDWTVFDPEIPHGTWDGDRAIIGALNYLESAGVNGIYFLPLNLGGDGQDTWPFVGPAETAYDKTHYAVRKLHQWETVLWEATQRGIHLHMVLAETELPNEQWLDGGQLGIERKLYYRELVARFGHHLAITWNLSEENDFANFLLIEKAHHLAGLDPYDHAITFHIKPDLIQQFAPFYGNPDFAAASVQYDPNQGSNHVEFIREQSATAGLPWVVGMDENTPAATGLTDQNAVDLRRRTLYDVLFSGGQIEWYMGYHPLPLGGDLRLEDFRTRAEMWTYMRHARRALESVAFWELEPNDSLVTQEFVGEFGQAEAFANPGAAYAIYLPDGRNGGRIDLIGQSGPFERRWFDPRAGEFVGQVKTIQGGGQRNLGLPPSDTTQDWVAIVRRPLIWTPTPQVSLTQGGALTLELDGGPTVAGMPYMILGSLSGTSPGINLPKGKLPLNQDSYFDLTFQGPNPLSGGFGVLDEAGRATATLALTTPSLAGMTVDHAWIVDPLGLQVPSPSVSIDITP